MHSLSVYQFISLMFYFHDGSRVSRDLQDDKWLYKKRNKKIMKVTSSVKKSCFDSVAKKANVQLCLFFVLKFSDHISLANRYQQNH